MNLSQTIPVLLLGTGLAILCPYKSVALNIQEVSRLATASTDFPIVKSVGLKPDMHVPWSKPVKVTDPFEGDFLAVFDRNYLGGYLYLEGAKQVISLWTRKNVRVLLTENSGEYGSSYSPGFLYPRSHYLGYNAGFLEPRPDYLEFVTTRKVVKLLLRIGEQVFQLEGSNGTFVVNERVATALKNAPQKNLDIRLVLEGGETVDSQIGEDTVKAWQTIYQG